MTNNLSSAVELQQLLEEKYKEELVPTLKGFSVFGLLGVIYEATPENAEKRLAVMEKMATSAWNNREVLRMMTEEHLASQPEHIRGNLEAQIYFAKDVKKEPVLEVYERGEFKGQHYIVFNDFFNEACL